MNSKFLLSQAFVILSGLPASTCIAAPHDPAEQARLEVSIRNVFSKFEESIDIFKTQLAGLSPKSTEKLASVCRKLKATIDQVEALFIAPIRAEALQLKGTNLENSNYHKLLNTLLNLCGELKLHFDLLYSTLHKSLNDNPSALKVAKNIKPIIDSIISENNFKRIDAQLAEAYTYAKSYDIIIEIKPQYRKIVDITEDEPSKTYHIKLAEAFALIRKGLDEIRKECKKPSTTSQAEMLRIIRSRL